MPSFSFSKVIPSGNPTIILHEPALSPAELAALSSRLMQPLHIGGEQVGALYYTDADERANLPRLRMMGGEFCVNATRAAALLLARQGRLADVHCSDAPVWGGSLLVSGMEQPVLILVSRDGSALTRAATLTDSNLAGPCSDPNPERGPQEVLLHCAARVDCSAPETLCRPLRPGITLVHMPGMSHALIDADEQPLPDLEGNGWRRASADWRSECGLSAAPASGVIWFQREGTAFRIWPALEVKATLSEHLESACGSASLALALWQWQHTQAGPIDVLQPSGETLRVFPAAEPGRAWISGPVLLAAEGVAHI
jgi:hypothetical protein